MPAPSFSVINDAQRLAVLDSFSILDTLPEAEFDDIVLLASQICGAPIALISLVDDKRQWFKARLGLDVVETPVEPSVCGHAISGDQTLVIPDLAQDLRTRDSVLVTGGPNLRFYAGAVLRTDEGQALGTVCVIDTAPRPEGLTPGQVAALEALARQTMIMLEARRALAVTEGDLDVERRLGASLRDAVLRTRVSQQAGGIGTFDLDIKSNTLRCTPEMCRIYGLPVAPTYPALTFESLTIDRDNASSTPVTRADGSAALDVEYRIRRQSDGAVRWISRRGAFAHDAQGAPATFSGAVQDITERKLTALRQSALLALGDSLRNVAVVGQAIEMAARTAGETLAVTRAGVLLIDAAGESLDVSQEWTPPGIQPRTGRYESSVLAQSVARLAAGAPLVHAAAAEIEELGADARTYAAMGVAAQIVVPLIRHGVLLGALYVHSATPRAWAPGEVEFLREVADRAEAAIAKMRAEQQQALLNQELSHRLKNTLTMVQAYARQTLRGVPDEASVEAFNSRVHSLARAHDVLMQENWAAARAHAVVDGVLSIHTRPEALEITGPDLTLGPRAALSLAMLLHELATNAVKYGALSVEAGGVEIGWTIEHRDGHAEVVVDWIESGGPEIAEPARQGFGSRLIRRGLMGFGKTDLDYAPAGLRARFRAPLSALMQE
jgi:two-component sensor histidine kinase/PAS domain-containing protein